MEVGELVVRVARQNSMKAMLHLQSGNRDGKKGCGGGVGDLNIFFAQLIVSFRTSTDWTKDHSVACGYCSEMEICDSYIYQ